MNIVLCLFWILIYIADDGSKGNVQCKRQNEVSKAKKIYSYSLLESKPQDRYAHHRNFVLYKRRALFHIRIPRKNLERQNLFSNDLRYKKINKFLENKKANKLCYLHINNNNHGIKKKRKKNKTLQLFFEKKKLLQEYFLNLKSSFMDRYRNTKIITKLFLSSSLLMLTLNLIGLKPEDIALHDKRIIRAFEFYRIVTSALFYGDISLYVLTNVYMLYVQSQELERSVGSSETLAFYLSQISILSVICSYLKKPFYSTALLKSLLFVNCMLNPYQKSNLIFGINIYNIYLPYFSILIDILHAQNLKASLSGILGVTSGSIYYLLNIYAYQKFNKKFFLIPRFLRNYLDSLNIDDVL
ncbi:degradation in the ER (DER1) like protein, putative [Plasmodium knowlesi strain H]|uniref:Derlin n=3 Tax=Plasmodium knowlesi TaxID=5850 RepID=A0A5K1VNH3_PLAKH|nr:DER1-like protein, putative [Plasmodium knowlesi strain H]OTN65678.1 Derlin [Plasmodium knowlesi]CAA9989626.1 DER1-like protein, putative [Plasmodium knowlesi strain H]SBO22714.1 degradation in the ER (DER1) like protein, putative [Plasmodium knowlesi strain H]SBO23208.1 degradation in the ER (DER1) like protein, putative [Plasmodium knowlesi strain H]VVS79100.1 DER1-like protein, putative [Plasmodium knowlesi strain H]|eukprot:XP_002260350.1 hypothetical protein, conserved in Plasmodium species [Plasmodium knowlesi strain H]